MMLNSQKFKDFDRSKIIKSTDFGLFKVESVIKAQSGEIMHLAI